MKPFASGLHSFDFVDDFSARHNLAEDGVTPALGGDGRVVQESVVCHIDEELGRCGVRIAGTGHRNRVVVVLQAVVGFITDGLIAALLLHSGFKAAPLHHEPRNHTMEDSVVVVTFVNVVQEVGDRLGGFFLIEFEGDDAVFGNVEFDLWVAHDLFHRNGGVDDDGGLRHIRRKWATGAGRHAFDFVNDIHASDDLAEHGIAP